ncbi:splicing factor 3B subunit 2-like isoform X2 [Triticum urartu]|uniref:splicing factor 3B subunit 2-like isoform X2 n=1 Tax=Triticum urartu TaxID=4572 RepID=UPI0020448D0F|nr:splicing factor 3B subunit 2-like isoform X2 [Triticum urartu]
MPTAVAAAASPTPRDSGRGRPRRLRRRRARKSRANAGAGEESARPGPDPAPQVEVEYVPENPCLGADDPLLLGVFAAVFEKFGLTGPAAAAPAEVSGPSSPPAEGEENEREGAVNAAMNKGPDAADAEQETPKKEEEEEAVAPSKKQRKQLRRVKISELRQMCSRPDVVEVWDGNAPDPKLLVCLKSCRNTVPVPRHWCQKRKYLQGKRGFQKQPLQLPDFIAATGIEKIRQVLHDAFFKYQTKPTLTSYGDLYYEGKEFELKLKVMKPGMLSQELKKALGMPDGAPPPRVTRMQFFGPPPSYPYLKIPGFNAPISPGDSLGDEPDKEEPLNRSKHWGDLDEEEDEEEEKEVELIIHEEIEEGVRSIDTVSSTPAGVEAPDVIELRKLRKESDNQAERPLYQVLEQKELRITHRALFASSHAYVSLAKPTEYVLVGAQDTPSSSGGNFGDGPGELGKPPTDEEEPIDRSKHWGELGEEEEEEEELEDGKLEKGILEEEEEEEVLEDGGIEECILEEEERKEELEDGEVEEGTLEELEEEELEDGEIEEATRQAEEEGLEDGEIVQGIRQEELEELEDGEIVEGILQEEEEEEELEEGEIVEGIRQAGEEEEELEEGEIVEGIRQEEKEEEELEDGEIVEGIHQEEKEEEELEDGEIVEGIRQEEKEEEELEDGEIVEGIRSGTMSSSTPASVETPDVIDLGKSWRKEPEKQAEKPFYQILEQKEGRMASARSLYLSSRRYVLVGAQDKPSTSTSSSGSKSKRKQKLERVDVTIHPDQLDTVEDALVAKYRELWGEESKGKGKGKMRRKVVGGEGSSWVSPPSWKTVTKRKKVDFKF